MKYFLWDEREVFLKFQMGWEVGEGILKERKVIKGRGRRWEEKQLESVEEFYVRPSSKPVSIFISWYQLRIFCRVDSAGIVRDCTAEGNILSNKSYYYIS